MRRDDEVEGHAGRPLAVLVQPVHAMARGTEAGRDAIGDLAEKEIAERRGVDSHRFGWPGAARVEAERLRLRQDPPAGQRLQRKPAQLRERLLGDLDLPSLLDAVLAHVVHERVHAGMSHVGVRGEVTRGVEQPIGLQSARGARRQVVRDRGCLVVERLPDLLRVERRVEEPAREDGPEVSGIDARDGGRSGGSLVYRGGGVRRHARRRHAPTDLLPDVLGQMMLSRKRKLRQS